MRPLTEHLEESRQIELNKLIKGLLDKATKLVERDSKTLPRPVNESDWHFELGKLMELESASGQTKKVVVREVIATFKKRGSLQTPHPKFLSLDVTGRGDIQFSKVSVSNGEEGVKVTLSSDRENLELIFSSTLKGISMELIEGSISYGFSSSETPDYNLNGIIAQLSTNFSETYQPQREDDLDFTWGLDQPNNNTALQTINRVWNAVKGALRQAV